MDIQEVMMKSEKNEEKEIKDTFDEIALKLKNLSSKYPTKTEHIFLFSAFDEKNEYREGIQCVDVATINNLEIYIDYLLRKQQNMSERLRFSGLLNIPNFRVICSDDNLDEDIKNSLDESGGDWILKGEVYNVKESKDCFIDGRLIFVLEDKNGKLLKHPEPYEGFDSFKFIPDNYSTHN